MPLWLPELNCWPLGFMTEVRALYVCSTQNLHCMHGKPKHSCAHAEKFADNPGIVGYDMLNEPFGDEALQISPLYEDVAARIRKHDTKAILFVEPQACARTCQSCLCR